MRKRGRRPDGLLTVRRLQTVWRKFLELVFLEYFCSAGGCPKPDEGRRRLTARGSLRLYTLLYKKKMDEQIHEKLKEIKQSFRLLMNGVASQSMRQKGVSYKINWGVPLPELQKMAAEYGKDYGLAVELWKEDIRECQVLATLIMPAEKMDAELVDVWMERLRTQEMAELLAFNLLQYLDFAPSLAYRWIASASAIRQLCGYQLEPNERGVNEFLDQARTTLEGNDLPLKHAAYNCVLSFCGLGADYEAVARKALAGMDLL